MPAGSGPSAGLRPGEVRSAVTEALAAWCALPLPGESVDGVTGTAGTACAPPPPGGSRSTATATSPSASPEPRPRGGSRIGDVTSARIVRGGLARIEPGRIPSRWARTVRGGVDRVALGSHYASPPRPRPRDSVERTRNYASPPRPAPFRGRGPAAPVRESGRPAGADAGRARAGPGPVRVSCTPSRA